MMRFWLGLWLLSSSWLFGLEYFSKPDLTVWAVLIALGVVSMCLSQTAPGIKPAQAEDVPEGTTVWPYGAATVSVVLPLLLLLPVALLAPWPIKIAPLLMGCGILLLLAPRAGRWLCPASRGMMISGAILFAQALALTAYKHGTARSHELPWPLPGLLAGVLRWLGVNAAADGSDLVLPTMRVNHHLGATWELLLDPATVCFLAGGLAAVALSATVHGALTARTTAPANTPFSSRKGAGKAADSNRPAFWKWLAASPRARAIGFLVLAAVLWLPLRAASGAAFFLHRALRTDYEAPLNLMNQFWSPWPHLLLLLPLALLVARWTRRTPVSTWDAFGETAGRAGRRAWLPATGSAFATAALFTLAVLWDPVGTRKPGRIAVDEYHSKWEPTGRPFDTEWYGHLSGYNYACIYDFCSRYYDMSRVTNFLSDAALANLDALIVKVPTERFAPEEIDAIVRFVERGGGLLLIGEHTDVFNTSYHLNPIARRFGFTYRYDCVFGVESFFDQWYQNWLVPHPALQNLRGFDFATSCSLEVGRTSGRGLIVGTGLKNAMADYHANNYYPQAVDHAAMRYGAFIQLWSTRFGRGRVLAFTDSTIFSNFSTFEPGKSELMLGMLEWLNRKDRLGNPRPLLLVLGAALLLWSALVATRNASVRMLMVAAGALGWSVTCLGLLAYQRQALPEPKLLRPCVWVMIDRTACDGPLSKGGFIAGKPDGFGIFERWILRLGYFTRRVSGLQALEGDLVVFLYPTEFLTAEYREALMRYVERGGKALIIDSPKNEKSTASSLLALFHLAQKPLPVGGTVSGPAGWPAVPVDAAREIVGGRALFHLDSKPVGAVVRHGKGLVVALGFGSRFTDPQMGVTGDVVPDNELKKVFELQFALLRAVIRDQIEAAASPAIDAGRHHLK